MKVRLPTRYQVDQALGAGGMGAVVRARDRELDRYVAIKVVRPELASHEESMARFALEAQGMARVRHPHLAEVYAFDLEPTPHLVMEYIEGETLAQTLKREGHLPPAQVRELAEQLGGALDALHADGVLHRDLKPGNIMRRAGDGRAVLMDLGLVRVDGGSLTRTGRVVGTPRFLPPEVLLGGAWSPRGDVYQLAGVLFRALTGLPHVDAETETQLVERIVAGWRTPLPEELRDLPPELVDGLLLGLDLDPNERPGSGAALAEALEGRRPGPPDETRRTRPVEAVTASRAEVDAPEPASPPRPMRRSWLPAGALLLGVAAGIGFVSGQVTGPPPPPTPAPSPPVTPSSTRAPIPPDRLRAVLEQHEDGVGALGFVGAGELLVSLAGDSSLAVWELDSRALVGWLPPLRKDLSFALGLGAGEVRVGGLSGEVHAWSLPGLEAGAGRRLHPGTEVRGLGWLGEGRWVSAGADGTLRLAGPGGREALRIPLGKPLRALAVLGPSRVVVASGTDVLTVELPSGQERARLAGHVAPVEALATGGGRVASRSARRVLVWDPERGRTLLSWDCEGGGGVALDPAGRRLAIPGNPARHVLVLDTETGLPIWTLKGHGRPVQALAFGGGGTLLASADGAGMVRVWDLREVP